MKKLNIFLSSAMTGELDKERDAIRLLFSTDTLLKEFGNLYAIEEHVSPQCIEKAFVEEIKESNVVILLLDKQLREAVKKEFQTAIDHGVKPFVFLRERTDNRDKELDQFISNKAYQFHCGCFNNQFDLCKLLKKTLVNDIVNTYCRTLPLSGKAEQGVYVFKSTGPVNSHALFDYDEIKKHLQDEAVSALSDDQLVTLAIHLSSEKWDFKTALLFLELAIIKNPNNWLAFNNKGLLLSEIGLFEDSIIYYKKALKINPESDPTYHNIGIYYFKKREYDKAIYQFQKALAILPGKRSSLSYLIHIHLIRKKYVKALEYARLAFDSEPGESERGNLALCLAVSKKNEEAKIMLNLMDIDGKEYLHTLALVEENNGNLLEAIDILDQYFEKYGIEYTLSIKKAYLLLDLEKIEELSKWTNFLEENLHIQADDYNNIGYLLHSSRLSKALSIEYFRKAVKNNPGLIPAWKNLQCVFGDENKFDEGIAISKEALFHHPSDPGIIGNMSQFLLNSGQLVKYTEFLLEKSITFFGFNLSEDQKKEILDQVISGFDVKGLKSLEKLIQKMLRET